MRQKLLDFALINTEQSDRDGFDTGVCQWLWQGCGAGIQNLGLDGCSAQDAEKEHRGPGSLRGRSWQEQRAPLLLDLLRAGELCDLVLLAGEPAERVPASRLLLAAASAALYARAEASRIADEDMYVLKCPEMKYCPAGSLGSNAGSQFEQVAAPLASELLATLEQEHNREILTLYEEQVRLREELRRVVDLMQQEVLPRERQLHDMFEKLNEAFHTSAQNLRRQQEEFHARASQMTQKHDMSRREMLDPLQAAETELTRIKSMLKHPLVTSPGLPPQLLQQIQQRVQQSYSEEIRVPMARRESGQTCPGCGNVYADDSNFCRHCGLKRSQAPIFQPPSPAISGSRPGKRRTALQSISALTVGFSMSPCLEHQIESKES
eukprot:s1228_g12.t2